MRVQYEMFIIAQTIKFLFLIYITQYEIEFKKGNYINDGNIEVLFSFEN